jgi:hypothetical protein
MQKQLITGSITLPFRPRGVLFFSNRIFFQKRRLRINPVAMIITVSKNPKTVDKTVTGSSTMNL